MLKFLRYNARHHLYFPRGADGKTLPQFNPIMSGSHGANGKRTWSFSEPLWLFRLRQRAFCFKGRHYCKGRGGPDNDTTPDTWDLGPDGNRTCSYCGSLHPEDMMKLVRKCIDTNGEDVSIEPSDKRYKVYVRQKDVLNAGQGGIKFYMSHVIPAMLTDEKQAEYALACQISSEQFNKRLETRFRGIAPTK